MPLSTGKKLLIAGSVAVAGTVAVAAVASAAKGPSSDPGGDVGACVFTGTSNGPCVATSLTIPAATYYVHVHATPNDPANPATLATLFVDGVKSVSYGMVLPPGETAYVVDLKAPALSAGPHTVYAEVLFKDGSTSQSNSVALSVNPLVSNG